MKKSHNFTDLYEVIKRRDAFKLREFPADFNFIRHPLIFHLAEIDNDEDLYHAVSVILKSFLVALCIGLVGLVAYQSFMSTA